MVDFRIPIVFITKGIFIIYAFVLPIQVKKRQNFFEPNKSLIFEILPFVI